MPQVHGEAQVLRINVFRHLSCEMIPQKYNAPERSLEWILIMMSKRMLAKGCHLVHLQSKSHSDSVWEEFLFSECGIWCSFKYLGSSIFKENVLILMALFSMLHLWNPFFYLTTPLGIFTSTIGLFYFILSFLQTSQDGMYCHFIDTINYRLCWEAGEYLRWLKGIRIWVWSVLD